MLVQEAKHPRSGAQRARRSVLLTEPERAPSPLPTPALAIQRYLGTVSSSLRRALRCCSAPYVPAEAQVWAAHVTTVTVLMPSLRSPIGPPDDVFEQQADQVADRVVVSAIGSGDRALPFPSGGAGDSIQRQAEGVAEEEEPPGGTLLEQIELLLAEGGHQAKSATGRRTPLNGFQSKLAGTAGSGQPMPEPVKTEMESAFGADFSGVRLHTDSAAAMMSRQNQLTGIHSRS